ncbi:putative oxidoreductase, aryl-alcohol dehydrogenase like protein [Spongiibacter sp. IMCC21906]|uniref:NADP(H)-dependent aldo-keto reductase n=1 Tax=Spongiibacter sp. IMCC21906 TaxID=1620392 RepID=UPI00062DE56F|nr:NADP(H)-dependent aldo-keto reductase [Spongiibacter sp. IMCC21906]AKH67788.1 putative oxidoreductase, aryl-alcohol dehydrogenase like protein [Spongiibacter sp. IMCC21906]
MKYRNLGRSELSVSELCLGTMTWGEQNSLEQACEQMDYAVSRGINFFDTAEMYPVPPIAKTQGRTEEYIGQWFQQSGKRQDIVLATKASGPGHKHIRDASGLGRDGILRAFEGSLERLKTDYVDLYQIHWPNRSTNFFGKLGYQHSDSREAETEIHEILRTLAELVQQGQVRTVGISNETPWGMLSYLRLADKYNLPRVASIQNPYNLLNRSFEVGLAEMAIREQAGLLAYSPLAFGVLSGKYRNNQRPEGARITLFERFQRYAKPEAVAATEQYCQLAEKHGLDPAQMALAFINQQPFVTSNIIGATTMAQLKSNIDSADLVLSDEVLEGIEAIHSAQPNPAP